MGWRQHDREQEEGRRDKRGPKKVSALLVQCFSSDDLSCKTCIQGERNVGLKKHE